MARHALAAALRELVQPADHWHRHRAGRRNLLGFALAPAWLEPTVTRIGAASLCAGPDGRRRRLLGVVGQLASGWHCWRRRCWRSGIFVMPLVPTAGIFDVLFGLDPAGRHAAPAWRSRPCHRLHLLRAGCAHGLQRRLCGGAGHAVHPLLGIGISLPFALLQLRWAPRATRRHVAPAARAPSSSRNGFEQPARECRMARRPEPGAQRVAPGPRQCCAASARVNAADRRCPRSGAIRPRPANSVTSCWPDQGPRVRQSPAALLPGRTCSRGMPAGSRRSHRCGCPSRGRSSSGSARHALWSGTKCSGARPAGAATMACVGQMSIQACSTAVGGDGLRGRQAPCPGRSRPGRTSGPPRGKAPACACRASPGRCGRPARLQHRGGIGEPPGGQTGQPAPQCGR